MDYAGFMNHRRSGWVVAASRSATASRRRLVFSFPLALAAFIAVAAPAAWLSPQAAAQPLVKKPKKAQPIMSLKDVKVGMKGYGRTVFHGVKISTFPFEVVSIEGNMSPKRPVIWVRCGGEQMQLTGPVSGMSGSPMYLWPEGTPEKGKLLGKNGLLIGAFAYGYSMGKDSYAGVQPIELMRNVGERTKSGSGAGQQANKKNGVSAGIGGPRPGVQIQQLLKGSELQHVPEWDTWRAKAIRDIVAPQLNPRDVPTGVRGQVQGAMASHGEVRPMMLPLKLGSSELVALTRPVFEPMGLLPLRVPNGSTAGQAPAGVDASNLKLEPGSMLSIPLAFGDLDLSASGTVTDVLPNGKVLAFGHAMFGQGDTALPVATGFVHFIQPSIVSSFKFSGSVKIAGALVRDENSAVVAVADGKFGASPVKVTVKYPNEKPREYNYKVAHEPMFTPMLTAIVSAQSVTAVRDLPREATLLAHGTLRFEGGRTYTFRTFSPGGSAFSLVMNMMPAISGMMSNSFERVNLVDAEVFVEVLPGIRSAQITGIRLDNTEVAPGGKIGVNLRMQPYRKPAFEKRIEMKVPEHLDDGVYRVMVTNAQGYNRWVMRYRPHRRLAKDVNDVLKAQQSVANVRDDAIYMMMQLPSRGLAVGRDELPELPSSRAVLIASPTNTLATAFGDWEEKVVPTDFAPSGELSFNIAVKKELKDK